MRFLLKTLRPTLLLGLALIQPGCIHWFKDDPPLRIGGVDSAGAAEVVTPLAAEAETGPVRLRRQGGTVSFRPSGAHGMRRLEFYEPEANVGPGAFVLTSGGSRAELTFPDETRIVLHNRTTALVQDPDADGSYLYVSFLTRLTANMTFAARVRLPGGAMVRVSPEAEKPSEATGSKPPAGAAANPLLQFFQGAQGTRSTVPGGVASSRGNFVATEFRMGRYVRVRNTGYVPLLVSHLGGEVALAPTETIDVPVFRGLTESLVGDPLAAYDSQITGPVKIRVEGPSTMKREGESIRVQAEGPGVRARVGGASFLLEPGENLAVEPLGGR